MLTILWDNLVFLGVRGMFNGLILLSVGFWFTGFIWSLLMLEKFMSDQLLLDFLFYIVLILFNSFYDDEQD